MSPNPTRKDIIQAIITNPTLDEEQKSLLVEEFIDEIKKEYPDLKNHATKSDVLNVELKLTKEMQSLQEFRAETKERFEQVDKRFEQVDKRFEQVDKQFEQVDKRFDDISKRLDRFMFWSLGLVMASTALIIKILG